VEFFEGSLDDYEQLVMDGSAAEQGAAPKSNAAAKGGNERKEQRQQAARSREELKPLRDKLRKLEQQMEREQRKLSEMEQKLLDPSLYDDGNKGWLAKLLHEQGELKRQLLDTEEAWLQASEQLENP
jgi:ATP-binding cassette subfamily F protein 3